MNKSLLRELENKISSVKSREIKDLTIVFETGIFTLTDDGTWSFSYYDQLMYPQKPKQLQ